MMMSSNSESSIKSENLTRENRESLRNITTNDLRIHSKRNYHHMIDRIDKKVSLKIRKSTKIPENLAILDSS